VLLESVPTTKSGVLVTANMQGVGDTHMLIATSEGVGGAVDGTAAETIVWSDESTELVTMFKSPYRSIIDTQGGVEVVPSTGSEVVLTDAQVDELVEAGARIRDEFEASEDSEGRARPWDVEFGFAEGKLWLFQTRPFIGNESLANVPALASYDVPQAGGGDRISLDSVIQ
jgi:phosphoenolpyruvate synthase/pyruvate phosphate dikinase